MRKFAKPLKFLDLELLHVAECERDRDLRVWSEEEMLPRAVLATPRIKNVDAVS